jgi:SAM-dependent methyltransferase
MKNNIPQLLKSKNKGIRIDLGCGANKQGSDWVGIDYRKLPGVDIVHDLEVTPYPLPSNCAFLVTASHVLEHINPHKGVFIHVMNEIWRLLKDDGEFLISVPYATSSGMYRDPTHCNFLTEETWEYFDPISPIYKGGLYGIYAPLPWKIKINTWDVTGNMEVALVKRKIDKSYHVNEEFLNKLQDISSKI